LSHNFIICNVDTDSASFCKPDMSPFSEKEQADLLASLNSLYPSRISWEHDGIYPVFCVLRAKNYILKDEDGKVKTKGSALRNPNKELAFREFIGEIINCLMEDKVGECLEVYNKYVREIHFIQDMNRFCSKKTITDSVLNPKRTNEQKVLDALQGKKVQMGDKVYMYFKSDESSGLAEHWNNDHDPVVLLKKLYNTIIIFENVLDMTQFTNYALKSHAVKVKLHKVLGLPEPEKVKKTRTKNNIELNN
jgi:hypothetical protein